MKKIRVVMKKEEEGVLDVDEERLVDTRKFDGKITSKGSMGFLITNRIGGSLQDNSFFLDRNYDWVLGKDNEGTVVLVPLKKEKNDDC